MDPKWRPVLYREIQNGISPNKDIIRFFDFKRNCSQEIVPATKTPGAISDSGRKW